MSRIWVLRQRPQIMRKGHRIFASITSASRSEMCCLMISVSGVSNLSIRITHRYTSCISEMLFAIIHSFHRCEHHLFADAGPCFLGFREMIGSIFCTNHGLFVISRPRRNKCQDTSYRIPSKPGFGWAAESCRRPEKDSSLRRRPARSGTYILRLQHHVRRPVGS